MKDPYGNPITCIIYQDGRPFTVVAGGNIYDFDWCREVVFWHGISPVADSFRMSLASASPRDNLELYGWRGKP